MSLMKHSQHDEEPAILAIFGDHFHPGRPPRLLDIGAADGQTFSNSRALIERGNFTGVLIEPAPGQFAALQKLYANCPAVELHNVAIGTGGADGPVTFFETADLVSTTDLAHRDKWADTVAKCGNAYREITVEQWTPQTLLSRCPGPYDFINIDVEGTSANLFLAMLAIETCRPKVWMIEHDDRATELSAVAQPHGYRPFYLDGNNLGICKL